MEDFTTFILALLPIWIVPLLGFINVGLLYFRNKLPVRKCNNYLFHAIGIGLMSAFYIVIIVEQFYGLTIINNHNAIIRFTIVWQQIVWMLSNICAIRGNK